MGLTLYIVVLVAAKAKDEEAILNAPLLPAGYRLVTGADVLELRRPDGSLAATFSARGFTEESVGHAAWEDYAQEQFEDPRLARIPPPPARD